MANIPNVGIAKLSQIKLPTVKPVPPKAPPAPPPKASAFFTASKPSESLGLYTQAKPAPAAAAAAAKPEKLDVDEKGIVAGNGNVVVDIEASDSGYANKIFFSTDNFKTKQYIGTDNQTGSVDLGSFKAGTKIQFGIDNGQGDFFRTGGASANSDKVDHTQVSKLADGAVRVGFEDLRGGGDRDFNDAIIKVRSVVTAPPVQASTPKATEAAQAAPAKPAVPASVPAAPPPLPPAAPVATKDAPAKPVVPPAPPVAAKEAPAKPVVPAAPPVIAKEAPAKPVVPAAPPVPAKDNVAKPATPVATQAATKAASVKPATPAAVPAASKNTPAKPAAPAASTAPATPAAGTSVDKTNRSGLGDGTNPGQGAGTVKSPNQGTLNPGGLR